MWLKSSNGWVNHTHSLLKGLLHGTTNTHHFSNRLHCRTNLTTDVFEFRHIPTRNLGDDVIQTGLKSSLGLLCHRIDDLCHGDSETQFGSHKSKWISSCFRSQSRGSGKTSIDLDNAIFKRFRMEGVLNVTFSDDTKMANSSDSSITKHVIFFIRQSLGWSHNHTISCVDSKRIEVFHVTNGHTIVISITDNLVLNFLPSLHALFDKNLRGCRQGFICHVSKVIFIVAHSTSKTSESKGRSNHERISDILGSFNSFFDRVGGVRLGNLLVNLMQTIREQLSVFGVDNNIDGRSEDFHTVFFENSGFVHFDGTVECCLSTHGNNNTIGLLLLDYLLNEFGCHGKEESVVGLKFRLAVHVCLDRRNVRVHKNDFFSFFFESLNSLSSGVIEFSSLTNRGSSTSQQKYLMHIGSGRGRFSHGECNLVHGLFACLEESIEHKFSVGGSGCSFGVELRGKVRSARVSDTFIGAVVRVGEQSFPSWTESGTVNNKTVVLGRNVAFACLVVQYRLVLPTVAEGKLLSLSTSGKSHELVSQTNTVNRLDLVVGAGNNLFELFNGFFAHCGITRSIRQE
mmetsp:Transcript_14734/g.41039  ORF Transcript_14734/g.41039 Transcript_14734/m.41039 type:complete len:570 (-) Transcript_14734:1054-2763(-)